MSNAGWSPSVLLKSLFYRRYGDIWIFPGARVLHPSNLLVHGRLMVGLRVRVASCVNDATVVELSGTLSVHGRVTLGTGCRVWIGPGARCEMSDCYFSGYSTVIIAHRLVIGAGCAISWGCQFLDSDWNTALIHGSPPKQSVGGITVGEHVWIGSNASILKGVSIGSGSIIASGSVVTKPVPENVMVAGNPAHIIRTGVSWVPGKVPYGQS